MTDYELTQDALADEVRRITGNRDARDFWTHGGVMDE